MMYVVKDILQEIVKSLIFQKLFIRKVRLVLPAALA